ncbi:hypothetical protein AAHE18_07G031500 [Arachis hypogaea]
MTAALSSTILSFSLSLEASSFQYFSSSRNASILARSAEDRTRSIVGLNHSKSNFMSFACSQNICSSCLWSIQSLILTLCNRNNNLPKLSKALCLNISECFLWLSIRFGFLVHASLSSGRNDLST